MSTTRPKSPISPAAISNVDRAASVISYAILIGASVAVVGGVAKASVWGWRKWRRARAEARHRDEPNRLLFLESPLQNTYVMVRHGESTANVAAIISSDPAVSTVEHGLTPHGQEQVIQELAQWSRTLPPQPVIVISSDFTRARETAQIIHQRLRVRPPLALNVALRERFFGKWNGTSTENYTRVWTADARSATHTQNGVERSASLQIVLQRCDGMNDLLLSPHFAAWPFCLLSALLP
jgi:hypothetical protein